MASGAGEGEGLGWDEAEAALEPTQQLPLDREDDRLPWLESADDEEEDYRRGSDTGRLLLLALAGFVLVGAVIGGLWWLGHRGDSTAAVAEGGVIKAPTQPYKEAPKDPGGKTFDGTGDTSFAVSEGQTRPAKLAGSDAPAPSAAPVPSTAAAPTASPRPSASPTAAASATPAAAGVGVQVGAYSSQASAEAGWSRLAADHAGVLSGVRHRVVAGKADIGTVYRLQAVAGDVGAATALCAKLKGAGVSCQVK